MSVIEKYTDSLSGDEKAIIVHMYNFVHSLVPDATEGLSYGMPTLKYKGKSIIALMARKSYISLYPFCRVSNLKLDLSSYEQTSGSIHFTREHPISDELLEVIVRARMEQISN